MKWPKEMVTFFGYFLHKQIYFTFSTKLLKNNLMLVFADFKSGFDVVVLDINVNINVCRKIG